MLVLIAIISSKIGHESKFVSINGKETTSFHQMQIAIKNGLIQIKGNRILFSLAVITLFVGLASEGFDRLWGAHFIEGFQIMKRMQFIGSVLFMQLPFY